MIFKTRDKEWSPTLRETGFYQFLNIHKCKRAECWGFKIKGWWRKGDIRTTKSRKSFECWVKTTSDVPIGAQKSLTEVLTAPQHNVGKDSYIVDLESDEKLYCLGTESGLLGAFGFEGTCTVGDDSYDPPTKSMGSGFCNFNTMQWNTTSPLTHEHPYRNNGFDNPTKWAEKRKTSARIDRN